MSRNIAHLDAEVAEEKQIPTADIGVLDSPREGKKKKKYRPGVLLLVPGAYRIT